VALARALLPKPELVLADEPTGNLDEANSTAVLDVLASYAASGHTVLMVNHDPQARDRANRRIAMAAGKLTPE
jgi:putative ABC transport system ATP-binding protein